MKAAPTHTLQRAARAILPTRSGFILLVALALLIWAIAYFIFWTLRHAPEGSPEPRFHPPSTSSAPHITPSVTPSVTPEGIR